MAIHKLAPYLSETADLFEEATAVPPKLVPIEESKCGPVAEGLGYARRSTGLSSRAAVWGQPRCLLARGFGSIFKHVNTPEPTASYESKEAWHTEGSRSS